MKIIICGGRDYHNKEHVYLILNEINKENQIAMVVSGDAPGVDTLAINWARDNKISYMVYRALWDIHGKAAGPIRNEEMISNNLDAKFLLAFPGGQGTKNAILLANKNLLEVINLGVKENEK